MGISIADGQLPKSIGVCLSGGGFRAAAFHLGALAYLQRVDLLKRVTTLSTVSGGTITGAMYAVSRLEQLPFIEFYKQYYETLEKQQHADHDPLIKQGLRYLGSGDATDSLSARRNLIASMAEAYSQHLFIHGQQQRPYLLGDLLNGDTEPLTEITFNATDFSTSNGTSKRSFPAIIACRLISSEVAKLAEPFMFRASVTMSPLKPIFSLSRPVMIFPESEEGNSSSGSKLGTLR